MEKELFIGIDGGGTHSTAVAVYTDGAVAAVVSGGGLNFLNDGVEVVRERLTEMVQTLARRCPGAKVRKIAVGMSALDGPGDEETHRKFTVCSLAPQQLILQSDAYIALMGFTKGEPGAIVICGTGSMLLMCDGAGRQVVSGGWGYLLGDTGSGYTLARQGLGAVIAAFEGLGPQTALTEAATAYFQIERMRQLIDRVYEPAFTPDRMAGFARCVLKAAAAGDGAAREILNENMARLARQTATLTEGHPEVRLVGLYGGIFQHSDEAVAAYKQALNALAPHLEVGFPEFPPELGAVIHLMRQEGLCTPQILNTMKMTYKEF